MVHAKIIHNAWCTPIKTWLQTWNANYKNKTLKTIEKNVFSFATNLDQVHVKNTNVWCSYNDRKIFAMPTVGDCPNWKFACQHFLKKCRTIRLQNILNTQKEKWWNQIYIFLFAIGAGESSQRNINAIMCNNLPHYKLELAHHNNKLWSHWMLEIMKILNIVVGE
jgi:hypothetical protein